MKFVKHIIVAGIATALLSSFAVAAPGHKAPKSVSCPACHMALSKKKDKAHTVAVKIKGKTYYCCAACPMNKKAGAKTK